jgi:hypothetical protein
VNKLSNEKILTLKYEFNGLSVKKTQYITDFIIYADEEVIKYAPSTPVEIYGSGERTFTFK